jgi:hypothetical protein
MDGEMRQSEYSAAVVVLVAVVVIVGIGASGNPFREPPCTVPVLIGGRFIPQGTPGNFIVKSIPQGTSGETIVKRHMYLATRSLCGQRQYGAITDPASLVGRTALWEIFPGKQLAETDFVPSRSSR